MRNKAFFVLNLAPSFLPHFLSLLFAGVVVVSFIESQETRRETAAEVAVKNATLNNPWRRVGKVRENTSTSAGCSVVDIAMLGGGESFEERQQLYGFAGRINDLVSVRVSHFGSNIGGGRWICGVRVQSESNSVRESKSYTSGNLDFI